MSLSMLRYFIMGLKKILQKGYCRECNKKLLVPSWSLCDDCDFTSFRNRYLRKQIATEKAKLKTINRKYRTKKALDENVANASILLLDENGQIIGYKM